jgi:Na+/melibiose symporter-like transporter
MNPQTREPPSPEENELEVSKSIYDIVMDRSAEFDSDREKLNGNVNTIFGINAGLLTLFFTIWAIVMSDTSDTRNYFILGTIFLIASEIILIILLFTKQEYWTINILLSDPEIIPKIRKDSIKALEQIAGYIEKGAHLAPDKQKTLYEKIKGLKDKPAEAIDFLSLTLANVIANNQEILNKHYTLFNYACVFTLIGVGLLTFSALK